MAKSLRFAVGRRERRWLINESIALDVLLECAKPDRSELGKRLFNIFCESRPTIQWNQRADVVRLARVVAVYSRRRFWFLHTIAELRFERDIFGAA